jgi:hypothetical protein
MTDALIIVLVVAGLLFLCSCRNPQAADAEISASVLKKANHSSAQDYGARRGWSRAHPSTTCGDGEDRPALSRPWLRRRPRQKLVEDWLTKIRSRTEGSGQRSTSSVVCYPMSSRDAQRLERIREPRRLLFTGEE